MLRGCSFLQRVGSSIAFFRCTKGLMTKLKDKNRGLNSRQRSILASFPGGGADGSRATSLHYTGCSLLRGARKGVGEAKRGLAFSSPSPISQHGVSQHSTGIFFYVPQKYYQSPT